MADYYGEQEQQPTGHHKKHRQQQYEGDDAPAAQFEHMGNQAGGYNPGGGYGGNQQFPQPHQRPPRDEYAPPQAEQYGGGGGGGGYGGPGEYERERPRPSGFEGEGEQFPEHRQQRHQHQHQQHHPGGEYGGERPHRGDEYGGERPHRGEQRGEYDAPPPSEYGNRQGQGYAPEGGRQGYGQGGAGYDRDDDDRDRRGGYGGDDGQDRRGGYGGGSGGRRTQEDEDAELAKKLDADLNHGGDLDAADSRSQAGGQQFHPPRGSPPGGGGQSGGQQQQFRRPQGAPPSGGAQYGGQQQQHHPSQAPQVQSYAHIPALAAEHDDDTDPAVYHQAIQKLQQSQAQGPPAAETQDSYDSHMAKHAQAYGPNADHAPMSPDDIGSAAAMEALKMSAGPGQSGQAPPAPAPAAHPDSHVTSTGGYPAYPSSTAQSAPSGPPAEEEEEESGGGDARGGGAQDFLSMAMGKLGGMGGAPSGGASPGAGGAGGGGQDKLVALAMSQAGKLFDKKNGTAAQGGNQDAKADAMHAAAATAMRLAGTYKTTGKLSLESGDMQQLMGAAMSFLHKS